MTLSKKRNRDRMRLIRLHVKKDTEGVQPKPVNKHPYGYPGMVGIDADGQPIYEE